ncbi:MAG: choice-of-anchor tandem repeat NxxGxxAF-containing protein [Planctomycetota bacterium]
MKERLAVDLGRRCARRLLRTWSGCLILVGVVDLSTSIAEAQPLVASPLWLDGTSAPASVGVLDNLDRPNVNAAGVLAFTADMIGTVNDDLLVIDGLVLAREGDAAPAVAGGFFGNFDAFRTPHQLNAAGSIAFISSLTGVPANANQTLYIDLQLVAREGDAAPGLAGRTFEDFEFAALADDGTVVFRADLDGTAFDRAIYRGFTPIAREGETIGGTPFDGHAWDEGLASFAIVTTNPVGDVLFVGDTTDPDASADEGLFRIDAVTGDLELLLREGALVAANSGIAALTGIQGVACGATGSWIVRGSLDTTPAFDSVAIAQLGATAPAVLLQEGDLVPGLSAARVGEIQGVALNGSDQWVVLAEVIHASVTQGLFLDGTLVLATHDPVAGVPNSTLTSIGIDQVVLTETGEVVFEGSLDDGSLRDGIFRGVAPIVAPVADVTCSLDVSGIEVIVAWTQAPGSGYDGIRVYLDGVEVADLAAGSSSFVTPAVANGSRPQVCVVPYIGTDTAPVRCCSIFALIPPDFEACRFEQPAFVVGPLASYSETVTLATGATIDQVEVAVNIDHSSSFLVGIDPLEVTSPQGTTVRLHDGNGSGPSLRAIYSDLGRPNGAPFEAGDLMQPTGPGALGDFQCQEAAGVWTLDLTNASAVSTPIVEDWCVRVFERTVSCIEPVTRVTCSVAASGDRFDLSWQLPASRTYDAIRVFVNGVPVIDLPGNSQSFQTTAVAETGAATFGIVGLVGTIGSDPAVCTGLIILSPDVAVCSVPPTPVVIPANATYIDTVLVARATLIRAVQVTVDVGHTTGFIAGIDPLEVSSPAGTTVRLHAGGGALDPLGLHATYADGGRRNGPPFSAGDPMQPSGPGTMADFGCEMALGPWTYRLTNSSSLSQPIQEGWCLGLFEQSDPRLVCCEAPVQVQCSSAFCAAGDVVVTWSAASSYTQLELIRDDGGLETVIALAPTDVSYSDLGLRGGVTYTYRLRAYCGSGGAPVESASCSVTHGVPPVTDISCVGDRCAGTVTLAWNGNGVPYTNVTLLRDGSVLANVTGATSYIDTPPGLGPFVYEFEVVCGVDFGPIVACSVELTLTPPSRFTCASVPCTGAVQLAWENEGSYDTLTLLRDGVALPVQPNAGDRSYFDGLVSPGLHQYELIATCIGSAVAVQCEALVVVVAGQTDLVLELEGPDDVASARSICEALRAIGRNPLLVQPTAGLLSLPCGIDPNAFVAIWVAAGTFPFEYDLTTAEGDLLAAASVQGVGVYLEGGDLWGFAHDPSGLDARDGIEIDSVLDGGDAFTTMDGAAATAIGLDTSSFTAAPYYQASQAGNDFTDELVLTGSTLGIPSDADVLAAAVIWTNAAPAMEFATGIGAVNSVGGAMISVSWEFGGFQLDPLVPSASAAVRADLMARYVSFFGVPEPRPERIVRGDANQDGLVDIGDAIFLLAHAFPVAQASWPDCYPPAGVGLEDNPSPIFCLDAADANDDEAIDIGDAIAVLNWLFGQALPLPFPGPADGCGEDPGSPTCVPHHPSLPAGYRRVDFADPGDIPAPPVPLGCRYLTDEALCP